MTRHTPRPFLSRLSSGPPLLADGAMGTLLHARGVSFGANRFKLAAHGLDDRYTDIAHRPHVRVEGNRPQEVDRGLLRQRSSAPCPNTSRRAPSGKVRKTHVLHHTQHRPFPLMEGLR